GGRRFGGGGGRGPRGGPRRESLADAAGPALVRRGSGGISGDGGAGGGQRRSLRRARPAADLRGADARGAPAGGAGVAELGDGQCPGGRGVLPLGAAVDTRAPERGCAHEAAAR